ncbi:hypothetical protein N5D61_24460 [Pseudomonas sp. GD03842]|uniref:hypothetical protein n=1 Tax=Pseudomonas sp. GD03842 TaxID=2975385 RepID=UPI00244C6FE4|nr:hypothetical protein [Pseudomonas sp. GD03842]MDH0749481.1 hypothetical protein [Pseudomonas sp. GD03842]
MNQQWKLVPVEPTKEMIAALTNAPLYQEWSAILAAAPSPPKRNAPVAIVNDSDDGLFVEILFGDNGSSLKFGDKLYAHPVDVAATAPVPPAGDEIEVLAFLTAGGRALYFPNPLIELADGDIELVDRAHVTRLQAKVAALQARLTVADQRVDDLQSERDDLNDDLEAAILEAQDWHHKHQTAQSDLTKARELLNAVSAYSQEFPESLEEDVEAFLAHQSAPAAKDGR